MHATQGVSLSHKFMQSATHATDAGISALNAMSKGLHTSHRIFNDVLHFCLCARKSSLSVSVSVIANAESASMDRWSRAKVLVLLTRSMHPCKWPKGAA